MHGDTRGTHPLRSSRLCSLFLCAGLTVACTSMPQQQAATPAAKPSVSADPYPSTYRPAAAAPTLIRGATVLTGTGTRLENADVLMHDGRIEAVGPNLATPADARVIEASRPCCSSTRARAHP